MASDSVDIEITGHEAKLILKHAAPFEEEAMLFKQVAGKPGYHRITIGKSWLEWLIGDLCHVINHTRSSALMDELDELCGTLESAMTKDDDYWFG